MSTIYDTITISTPTGGISTTYTGTQISVNTPAISDVTKAEAALKAKQTLNGYSYPWPGGVRKNKFPSLSATSEASGITATKNADGSITLSGTATATVYFDVDTNFSTAAVHGYYFSGIPSPCPYGNGVRFRICASSSNRTAIDDYYVSTAGVVTGGTITDNSTGRCLSIRVASGTAISPALTLYPMISAIQDDTYEPYENVCPITGSDSVTLYKRSTQGSSYENSYYKYLNTTVYNGSFEYITGKVTKTYASITLNSSDLTWAVYNDSSTSRAFRATISDMKSLSHSSYDSARCFCTHASWTTSSERLGFGKFYYSYGYVYFPDYNSKRFNSVDEFTAWLDLQESRGTPVTILYPLSTPAETTVSTTTIKTLAGQNYFDTSSTAANRLPLTMTILQTSFILPRPLNFAVQREDIYAGQYTTCTGATRADKIGWKYSDMTWSWDGLKQSDVEKLCSLSGECTLTFDDPSGDTIQESFIRSSVVSMRCRNKFENEYWWTGVSCSISFIGSHTD